MRHWELAACEDEQSEMAFVTFSYDDEGKTVEIGSEVVKRVKLGEEAMWNSMFRRPRSVPSQKHEMKGDDMTWKNFCVCFVGRSK